MLITSFVLCSCSDNENFAKLQLDDQASVLFVGENAEIQIISGSGDYSLIGNENADVVLCELRSTDNTIFFSGLATGATRVTIKDNQSMQEAHIRVKVISPYVPLKVLDLPILVRPAIDEVLLDMQANTLFSKGYFVTLLSEQSSVFVFRDEESMKNGEVLFKGTFRLKETGEYSGMLELLFDDAVYSYSLDLQSYYNLRIYLKTLMPSNYNPPKVVYLNEFSTDYYREIYPSLELASVAYRTLCISPYDFRLPVELFF